MILMSPATDWIQVALVLVRVHSSCTEQAALHGAIADTSRL